MRPDLQEQGMLTCNTKETGLTLNSEFIKVSFKVKTPQNIANDPWIQSFTCKLNSMEIHMGE